jgi:hypothetical protein
MTGRFPFTGALIGLMAIAGSPLLSTTQAHAQAGALCTFNPDNGRISPGMTGTNSKGHWSAGPTSFDCHGTIDGQRVSGPGTIVESGPLDGSCSQGSGSGVQTITIPTVKGTVHLEIPITFSWMGAVGAGSGPDMKAAFEFMPTAGDCINAPVAGYKQFTQEFLSSS